MPIPSLPISATQNLPPMASAFRAMHPPIIMIGMHRSGTSLVAGMLTILGVYMDPAMMPPAEGEKLSVPSEQLRQDGYAEAEAFRLLNEALMTRAGSVWDDVDAFLAKREQPDFARACLQEIAQATSESLESNYRQLMPDTLSQAWGWKDPRTSLTLPYWLPFFPEARIINMRRNPEKVVDSLVKRSQAIQNLPVAPPPAGSQLQRALRHPDVALRYVGRRLGLVKPPTPAAERDRAYWHRLCEQHVQECLRYRDLGERYLEITFEEVVQDPAALTDTLTQFVGISPSEFRKQQAVAFVQRDK